MQYVECGMQTESWDHLFEQSVAQAVQTESWDHIVEQVVDTTVARMEASFEKRTDDIMAIIETLRHGRDELRVAVRAADLLLRGATGAAADSAARDFMRYSWDAFPAAGDQRHEGPPPDRLQWREGAGDLPDWGADPPDQRRVRPRRQTQSRT